MSGLCLKCGNRWEDGDGHRCPEKQGAMLSPHAALLVKIGSALVHFDEFTSPGGHEYDLHTAKQLLADPEVAAWIEQMTKAAMLPCKRS